MFKIGILRYFSWKSNRELSNNARWLLNEQFTESGNLYMAGHGKGKLYDRFDFALFCDHSFLSDLEISLMKYGNDFNTICEMLGIVAYLKLNPEKFEETRELVNTYFGEQIIEKTFLEEIKNLKIMSLSTN